MTEDYKFATIVGLICLSFGFIVGLYISPSFIKDNYKCIHEKEDVVENPLNPSVDFVKGQTNEHRVLLVFHDFPPSKNMPTVPEPWRLSTWCPTCQGSYTGYNRLDLYSTVKTSLGRGDNRIELSEPKTFTMLSPSWTKLPCGH